MSRPLLLVLLLAALALPAISLAGSIHGNPANDPRLLKQPIEQPRYDQGRRCLRNEQRGTRALERWLGRHWRGASWGIMRCEKLSPGNFSLHAEGRALDWHLDAGIAAQRRAAQRLIRMLLAPDREGNPTALARRMGVQGLIFACRNWWAGMTSMSRYDYCYTRSGKRKRHLNRTAAHLDHVHIELNWPGARLRTSFWNSPLSR
ncbi:MAG TPA: hypothetical protein VKA89_03420 [Solirubrobacterales bacterium]|nr:hypothetical protein [Solirubrobacterales bacterium]